MSVVEGENRKLSRRGLLGAGAAGVAVAAARGDAAQAAAASYPRVKVVTLAKLKTNRPVSFEYPLKGQASMLVDVGHNVPGGVGPHRSIVAYSTLCQHMGCPVTYDRGLREFVCHCHQTRYDPERLASIIQGVAARPLPRILLQVKAGAVWATGVDGLIYGYRTNLAPGKKVRSTA